jgi:prepilin-type N-terminal cleavage/methylation domain-containing protein/prepilin-type processing-associated H-X9-DG protein
MHTGRTTRKAARRAAEGRRAAFSLIELMVVIAIIGLLVSIAAPTVVSVRHIGQRTVCGANLRTLFNAYLYYLRQNNDTFFPYREVQPDGTLWYWGFEKNASGAAEGSRPIDLNRARLAPYFSHSGTMKICPTIPYEASYFKRKYNLAGYGYAINQQMLWTVNTQAFTQVTAPDKTVVWADAAQINTWQAPASPSRPMLEEWYYLDNRSSAPATFHFRHMKTCNAAFADGTVRELTPYWLDSRLDKLVGRPEAAGSGSQVSYLLRLDK